MDQKSELGHFAESILFLVDIDSEMSEIWMENEGLNRLGHIKQCILTSASFKLTTYPQHRFNVAVFDDQIKFLMPDFTSDLNEFRKSVNQIQASQNHFKNFDLSKIQNSIQEIKYQEESSGRFFRIILIFGRSDVIPISTIPLNDAIRIDMLYLHQRVNFAPLVQEIYDKLCVYVDLAAELSSYQQYVFESVSSQILPEYFARMMAHGLQRISQDDFEVHPIKDISKMQFLTSDIDSIPLPEIGRSGVFRGALESAKAMGKNFLPNRQQIGFGNNTNISNNSNNKQQYQKQQQQQQQQKFGVDSDTWDNVGSSQQMDLNQQVEVNYGPSTQEFSEKASGQGGRQFRY